MLLRGLWAGSWQCVAPPRVSGLPEKICGYRIMVIISAFQAEDDGSIPFTRSGKNSKNEMFYSPLVGQSLALKNCLTRGFFVSAVY